jgi:hypothetical protein
MYEYTWMCPSLAPEPFDEFYSNSVFKSLSIIDRCPLNMNIVASRTWDRSDKPPKQSEDFLENGFNYLE